MGCEGGRGPVVVKSPKRGFGRHDDGAIGLKEASYRSLFALERLPHSTIRLPALVVRQAGW